ncbi:MAG: SWIM zinc finger domain-containing protein, partial [Myxococcota bacterium]|nr:SWIM zinc finger domain-containing protein [Myxococcota bacterium]
MLKTKKSSELTLRDLLSRLTLAQAKKLLGPQAEHRLSAYSKREIDIDEDVSLDDQTFELRFKGAKVRLSPSSANRKRLAFSCSKCAGFVCDHVGAAFGLVLENKVALGLSRPPEAHVPLEHLNEQQLQERVLSERARRAAEEKMVVRGAEPSQPYTDYVVTNSTSGKSYKVALRGLGPGQSFCSCPDFRKNTLGTCKHILRTEDAVRRNFSKAMLEEKPIRTGYTVHLVYGKEV